MFTNYLKVALRNLWKNKTFSLINVIGLATGLACFILIALYVADELRYDRHNKNAERIYRVDSDIRFGGNDLHLAVNSDPMGPTLKKDFPEVEEFVRFFASTGHRMVKKGNDYVREDAVAHADSTLFDVFTLPLLHGNPRTALAEPNTVVIAASVARKYFGSTDAVGKSIETDENGSTLYKVTAVMEDMPRTSHFRFDFLFSMDNVQYGWGNFLSHNFQTYILLKPGTDPKAFEKKMVSVVDRYIMPQAKQFMNINSAEEFEKSGNKLAYSLMPLTDIHLRSDRFPELGVNGDIQYVYIFSAVALFVLLLACINFMNLSTARSANRAKEVGVRKVLGSEKRWLVRQFLSESLLTTLLALLVALVLVSATLGYFNNLSGKELSFGTLLQPVYVGFLLLLLVVVGLLAGFYPAFFLASFKPIAVLKGKLNAGFKRSTLRSSLVVFQFATSIVLIVGTIVVYRQLGYIQNKKLGFNKDQVLVINGTGALRQNTTAFKNELAKLSGVKAVSFAGYLPVQNSSRSDNSYSTEAVMDAKNGFNMQTWIVDYDYLNLMGMELKAGRNFSKEFGTDSTALLINETTAQMIGGNPIGKKLYTNFQDNSGRLVAYTVVGVVKNFHYESLRQTVGPLSMRLGNPDWVTAAKVSAADVKGVLAAAEQRWKSMAPGMPFSYQFLDEAFDNMYRAEQRTGHLGLSFAIIAIIIACLGLFGLATYTAEQRIKEIGIRKVLGASVPNLVGLLSKDFLRLVFVAAIVALPLASWVMNRWLQDFAFRTEVSWWVLMLAALSAVVIALVTISFQSIRAARTNPVKNLRAE